MLCFSCSRLLSILTFFSLSCTRKLANSVLTKVVFKTIAATAGYITTVQCLCVKETNLPQSSGMEASTVCSLMKEITSSLTSYIGFQDVKLKVTAFDLREAKNERGEV